MPQNPHALDVMQLLNLHIGDKFDNYKELCKCLQVKPLAGNNKKAQLKVWEEQFSYTKDKYRFVITGIYPSVIPSNSRTTRDVEERMFLLLEKVYEHTYIKKIEDKEATLYKVHLTLDAIFLAIGVCNTNYIDNLHLFKDKNSIKRVDNMASAFSKSIFSDIRYREFCDFFSEVNDRGRRLLDTVFKKINSSYLAEVHKCYLLVYEGRNASRVATQEEYHKVREIISKTLLKDEYLRECKGNTVPATEYSIFLAKKSAKFYKEVCNDKWFRDNDIVRFAPMYEFVFTDTLAERLLRYGEITNLHETLLNQLRNSIAYCNSITRNKIEKEAKFANKFFTNEEEVVKELKGARSLANEAYADHRNFLAKTCLQDDDVSDAYLDSLQYDSLESMLAAS